MKDRFTFPSLLTAFVFLYIISLFTALSGMEFFSVALLIPLLIQRVKTGSFSTKKTPPLLYPLLAFIAVMWIGTLLSDSTWKEKLYDMQRARFFGLYFILFYALHSFTDKKLFQWMFLPVIFLCLYGTYQHFYGPVDFFRPEGKKILMYAIPEQKIGPLVVGVFNHHLSFSNMFMLYACLFFALGFLLLRPVELLLGSWAFLLCVWTESRSAWFAIPIVIGLICYQKGKKWFLSAMALVAILFSIVYFSDNGFKERFDRTVFEKDTFYSVNSDNPRMRLWKAQLHMFFEHPILGMGWNNNERKSKQYVDKLFGESPDNFYGHAHSEVLQLLSSTGIVGTILYFWIWICVFKMCFTLWKKGKDNWIRTFYFGVLVALISFHLQGLTQWNFGDAEVLHNIIFLWALIAARYSQLNATSVID